MSALTRDDEGRANGAPTLMEPPSYGNASTSSHAVGGLAERPTQGRRPSSSTAYTRYEPRAGATRALLLRQQSRQPIASHIRSHEEEAMLQSLDDAADVSEWVNASVKLEPLAGPSTLVVPSPDSKEGDEPLGVNGQHVGTAGNAEEAPMSSRARRRHLLTLDSRLSSLSTSLAMAQKDTLAEMDATMEEVASTVPRVTLELRLMTDAARTLQKKISQLQDTIEERGLVHDAAPEVQNGQHNTSAVEVLSRLAELSSLHARMVAARDVLSLAESWSTLSSDVSSFLLDARYDAVALRLSQAKSSLPVFERTPEYGKREVLLEELGNNLESKLRPVIEDALQAQDVHELQRLAHILDSIGRKDAFADIWRRSRITHLTSIWSEVAALEENPTRADSGVASGSINDIFRASLNDILQLLESEMRFVPLIFERPRAELDHLLVAVLDSLKPEPRSRVAHIVPFYEHEAILRLVDLHRVLLMSDVSLLNALSDLEEKSVEAEASAPRISPEQNGSGKSNTSAAAPGFPFNSGSPQKEKNEALLGRKRSDRRTSSMSMKKELSSGGLDPLLWTGAQRVVNSPSPLHALDPLKGQQTFSTLLSAIPEEKKWESVLFNSVIEMQLSYEALERAHMTVAFEKASPCHKLSELALEAASSHRFGDKLSQIFRQASFLAMTLSKEAIERAQSFTYGLAIDGLLKCVDEIFELFQAQVMDTFGTLSASVTATAMLRSKERLESGETKDGDSYGAGVRGDAQDEEWKTFEDGVKFLAALREAFDFILRVETSIASEFKHLSDFILGSVPSNEAVSRLCVVGDGHSTASFRLLLEASRDRLTSAPFIDVMKRTQALAPDALPAQSRPSVILLGKARAALLSQLQSLQRHLANIALSTLMPMLEVYAALPVWEATRLPGAVNEFDLAMPSFSLSPTEEMSRIGEALLDLPRLLEVWGESQDMIWGVQGLPYIGSQARQTILPPEDSTVLDERDHRDKKTASDSASTISPTREKRVSLQGASLPPVLVSPQTERRTSGTHRHTTSISHIAALPAGVIPTETEESSHTGVKQNESALQSYLSSICLNLVAHIVSAVLPSISRLSTPGTSQLAADLDYFLTILTALNIAEQSSTADVATNEASDSAPLQDDREKRMGSDKNEGILLVRTLEAWRDVCKLKDADGRRLRHLVRTGQAARGVSLVSTANSGHSNENGPAKENTTDSPGTIAEGFAGSEDKLRSLLSTEAFEMVSRMRRW